MTENEAKQVLKSMGWTPTIRKRRRPGTPYLYASRREKSRVIERYIAPISRLTQMTEVDIVAKLQQKRPQDGMRGEH